MVEWQTRYPISVVGVFYTLGGSSPPLTAKFKVMRPLAWQCANCNAFNAIDRVKCGKCNKDKKVKVIF